MGEVDRAILVDVGRRMRQGAEHYVAPRTEGERRMAALWQEVLGIPQVVGSLLRAA